MTRPCIKCALYNNGQCKFIKRIRYASEANNGKDYLVCERNKKK